MISAFYVSTAVENFSLMPRTGTFQSAGGSITQKVQKPEDIFVP
jgi:hypothetical protein